MLVRLIDNSMTNPEIFNPEKFNFSQKILLCNGIGLITNELSNYLKDLNKIRNQFAHNLQHHITFEEAVNLAHQAKTAGVKFDNEDFEGYSKFRLERRNIIYLLHDILFNVIFDLAEILTENGGEVQFDWSEYY
jgi:hypothetical protein